jgi:hypothetical protein
MSRIQFDLKIDLPRATGSAWKVPTGFCRVLLQVVEERRLVALGDAGEDREVDLERLLDLVEDAADPGGRRIGEDRVGFLSASRMMSSSGGSASRASPASRRRRPPRGPSARRTAGTTAGLEQRHVARRFVGKPS